MDSSLMKAMRALENSTYMKAMRDLQDSPSMRMIRELENSPSMRIMRDLQNSPSMKMMRALEKSPVMRVIRDLEGSSAMRVVSALADQVTSLNAGPLTFSQAYQEIVRRYELASHTNVVDTLDALASEVEEQAKHPSEEPLSNEFFLNLIFALFLFLYSQISANYSEDRILQRMERMESVITQQIAELNAHKDIDTFYIVERTAKLRTIPNTKSKINKLLPIGLKVRLVEKFSKWIKVEYFDYLDRVHRCGWVYKKYLKIMNPKKPKVKRR